MSHYESPQITEQRTLDGRLQYKSFDASSDATIKHGVTTVGAKGYQAPEITAQRDLDAKLFTISDLNDAN